MRERRASHMRNLSPDSTAAGPRGSLLPSRLFPSRACKSWSLPHRRGPTIPALCGCQNPPGEDEWQSNGETCDSSPAGISPLAIAAASNNWFERSRARASVNHGNGHGGSLSRRLGSSPWVQSIWFLGRVSHVVPLVLLAAFCRRAGFARARFCVDFVGSTAARLDRVLTGFGRFRVLASLDRALARRQNILRHGRGDTVVAVLGRTCRILALRLGSDR